MQFERLVAVSYIHFSPVTYNINCTFNCYIRIELRLTFPHCLVRKEDGAIWEGEKMTLGQIAV